MVAELLLAAFLRVLLQKLTLRAFIASLGKEGIGKKVNKWEKTLSAIEAVLCDAEEKQQTSRAVKLWLDDLKDLAYDVEDILDKFYTEMLRRKVNKPNQAGVCKVRGLFPRLKLHFNMKHEIQEMTDRLDEISERKDRLGLIDIGDIPDKSRPPSSRVLDGVPVVGRDSDRGKIVEFLLRNNPNDANFEVAAIVGMPGIGKTTLAQYVINDNSDILKEFDLKIWVCVSNDFKVLRVTKAILESVTSKHCDLDQFSNIQNHLCKVLTGKKFLLVLDDVWSTCNYDQWKMLQSPFHVGASGSKIIVTTRDVEVTKMMRAAEVHSLMGISNDDCWKVFEQHAYFNVDNGIPQNFRLLQEKIIAKCGGLPLAARTLGGLFGCKEITEWEKMLDNKLWLSDKSDILPVLQLSYYYLPSKLKRCFAYCSILPKDYEFGETQLILLWMAEGLIEKPLKPEDSRHLEDVASEYFSELLSRSLFQKSSKKNSRYVMHNLVSDMAHKVAGEICFRLEDKLDGSCSPKSRHLSYITGRYDGVKRFGAVSEVHRLRTFLPLTISDDPCNYLTSKVTLGLLPKLQYLRVLSLNGYRISQLPNSIGELKFLRYLDLSHTEITSLPESASTLYNLQTLILESCYSLKALPTNMKNLINLRHLSNSNTPLLEGMPAQLGQLTNLQTLCNFVVGRGSNSGIREIEPLLHLRGTLRLSRLENVNDIEDAKRADFVSKEGLEAFLLEWGGLGEKELELLNMLEPHRKLKVLSIKGYGGLEFSTWMGHHLFSNMTVVRLEDCKNCGLLPPLGQLPSLRKLIIKRMYRVESVGPEFYGNDNLPFPLLEILEFEEMKDWKEWVSLERDQGIGAFPCLKMLSISRCPKLEGRLPKNLALLSELVIRGCEQLVVSIANYKQLQRFDICDCKGVVDGSTPYKGLSERIKEA
ncbi:putative P-loop containing nucleoside triphosphate hydrolase, leucine-rich repeat domain, L [Rosa chinensis]|uniref:Putative P-loop containing nucleoside triphosphate hydrolase, leucine-rich repeat domain, L n=1 Tax=Rosa chinensis TaxID=74649 RepID=A0A2P6SAQ8_ROSCH|nr:putative P-loop containing nucleoside triphosphate hydrolase, leucine-rich repeat domain, L [Rosa chinensis]